MQINYVNDISGSVKNDHELFPGDEIMHLKIKLYRPFQEKSNVFGLLFKHSMSFLFFNIFVLGTYDGILLDLFFLS